MHPQRRKLLAEKEAEIRGLGGLSVTELTPSRRDFAMFVATQKQGIALVPRIKRADPDRAVLWPGLDPAAFARACDEAEAPALAVTTAALYGGSIDDLRTVSNAVAAPVLRDDLCLHPSQLHHARLHGADAVILPAAHLDAASLSELAAMASSEHMAAVVEVTDEADLAAAVALPTACIGLTGPAADGFADLDSLRALAAGVPAARTVLLLSEVRRLDELERLQGLIDAAVVGNVLLDAPDPGAVIRSWVG